MADYAISNVPRRVVYAASGTGPYAFTFEILSQTDIAVYKASTLLTLTTDYTVTINANGTGSVTLVTSAGTSNITIVGAKNIQRTTDFTTGGDLFANTLNDELDNQTIFIQQVAETAERGLKAPVVDPTDINMTLPAKASRVGTVLAFNATTGNPEAGPSIGSVTTVAAQSANINTVATNIGSVNTVAGNITNVNTVAGVSSNVTAVATNIANVNAVGADLLEGTSEINTVAVDIANVNTVGTNIASVNTVAGEIGSGQDVTVVAANLSGTNTIGTVATNIANVNATGTNIANVNAVGADLLEAVSEINTVATDITNVNTVGTAIAAVNTVAGISSNVSTVAGISANVTTVAGINAAVSTVATNNANVTTVATNIASVNTCATDIAQIITTANDLNEAVSEIEVCANNIANINTVGTNITNVNTVAGISANVTIAATNVADINNFADVYQGAKATDPTLRNDGSALQSGDLYFNTTDDVMKVREAGAWLAAFASLSGALIAANNLSDVTSTSTARTNLGLGTIATQAASSVAITGGSINGTTIGASTPSTGAFSTLSATGVTTVQAGSVSAPAITTTGDTNTGIFFPAADTIAFTEGGVESMRIDSSGRLGIGTASPGYLLDIQKSSFAQLRLYSTDNSTSAQLVLGSSTGASTASQFIYYDNSFVLAQAGVTERMTINSSGNVGIGTSSPAQRLSVTVDSNSALGSLVKNSNAGTSAASRLILGNDTDDGAGLIRASSTNTTFGANALTVYQNLAAPVTFWTNNTERMRIDSSGQVAVGPFGGNGNAVVAGSSSIAGFTNQPGTNLLLKSGDGSGAGSSFMSFSTSPVGASGSALNTAVERMRILSNGNVAIGTTTANFAGLGTDHTVLTVGNSSAGMGMLELAGFRSSDADLGRLVFGNKGVRLSEIVAVRSGGDSTNALTFSTSNAGSMAVGLRISPASFLQFNSGYGSVETAYGCRVWVNFNGTGTIATRGSGNVSSLGDNGAGDYTVNFATAMPDANYSVSGTCVGSTTNSFSVICGSGGSALATGSVRFGIIACTSGSLQDYSHISIQIFR